MADGLFEDDSAPGTPENPRDREPGPTAPGSSAEEGAVPGGSESLTGPLKFDPGEAGGSLALPGAPGSIERITQNLAKFQKLTEIVPMLTDWRDWIAYPAGPFGERAWPTVYACERIAAAAGVSIKKDLEQMGGKPYIKRWEEDEKGRYYTIEIHAYAKLEGHHMVPVVGMCSTRHQLFGQKGSDGEGNPIYKATSEIREADIVKTAYTDLMRQAVGRLLGCGNIDATVLDKTYGRPIPRVSFKSGKTEQTADDLEGDQKNRKRLWSICLAMRQGVDKEASDLLAKLTTFTVTEDGKKKEIPGVKDVARLKAKRLEYALRDANKRLEEWYTRNPEKKAEVEAAIEKHAV